MPNAKKGLVAPQNTFHDNIVRISNDAAFFIANARIVDYPIINASSQFCKLSGYKKDELMQMSGTCSYMYGEKTLAKSIRQFAYTLENLSSDCLEIVLYKKNRVPMWLSLQICPIQDHNSIILFYITLNDITALRTTKEKTPEDRFVNLAKSIAQKQILSTLKLNQNIGKLDTSKKNQVIFIDNEQMPIYQPEPPKTPKNIILHYSVFKSSWDWIILILTFYTALIVPYNVAFKNIVEEPGSLITLNSLVDFFFLLDIVLNFHTTFVGPSGEIISESHSIIKNYLKTWFIVDLISSLPYDLFNFSINSSISSMFSALKVLRLLRLGRVLRKLDHYMEYGAAVLLLLIFFFLLIAHWFACIWYYIGEWEAQEGIKHGWLHRLGVDVQQPYDELTINGTIKYINGPDTQTAYITALYFTLSCMTSVGFGNVSPDANYEKIFTICMMILGSLFYATIFGNVTTIFQQMYSSMGRYHEMTNSVREFMKLHNIPRATSERALDYIVSTWSMSKGIDTQKVLNYCPKDIKADICVHMSRAVFNQHPAFRLASDGCLRALATCLVLVHSAPDDLIYHQGESVDALCFVVNGSIEVRQDNELVAILNKNDVFGDNFWKHNDIGQSMANVKALTYVDMHIIKWEKLLEIFNFYKAFSNSFSRNITITYNLRNRFHFRKIVDVKREKRISEENKNKPDTVDKNQIKNYILTKMRRLSDVNGKSRNFKTNESKMSSAFKSRNSSFIGMQENKPALTDYFLKRRTSNTLTSFKPIGKRKFLKLKNEDIEQNNVINSKLDIPNEENPEKTTSLFNLLRKESEPEINNDVINELKVLKLIQKGLKFDKESYNDIINYTKKYLSYKKKYIDNVLNQLDALKDNQ
ncbi:hypothetical protein A3Q56_00198 [Intoshia linei]|uniref:Cyclic nucleotide-binding domain-containing protein n=1 Tax=Intoshia linei TaxID=1819745 RepID=A0A177BCG3_9BILA|nr:hypothetical protein A3Q56_00198 [Intoshia linei]